MQKPKQVYTTYIRTTPKKLWDGHHQTGIHPPILGGNRECLRLEEGFEMGTHRRRENEVWITGKVVECSRPNVWC